MERIYAEAAEGNLVLKRDYIAEFDVQKFRGIIFKFWRKKHMRRLETWWMRLKRLIDIIYLKS